MARHLTVDLYNCKQEKLRDRARLEEVLRTGLSVQGFSVIRVFSDNLEEDHDVVVAILREGHITMHIYADFKYVAIDVYLCQEKAQPEFIYKAMRTFFKPDKTKTTLLKRGDFSSAKDVKPKTKTHVAPLRKIHNTGAKVIRILARRNGK